MRLLVDAGPLLALLSERDAYHRWAQRWINESTTSLLTCEPVITEVSFLLKRDARDPALVLDLVTVGIVRLAFDLGARQPADHVRLLAQDLGPERGEGAGERGVGGRSHAGS